MSKKIQLKVVTPERLVLEGLADQVTLPTTGGELTILPNHIPIIIRLKAGDIVPVINGEYAPMAVAGGFLEVKNGADSMTEVIVMADFAEHVSELSDEKVIQAKARAEELKKQMENNEVVNFEHFASELERSLTRVKIADKWRTRKYRK